MKKNIILSVITLCLIYASCNKSNPIETIIQPKDSTIVVITKGLIPTAVNNYWVYTDSFGVMRDTIKIVSRDTSKGHIWWKTNKNMYGIGNQFAIRNDSIFNKQNTGISEVIACVFIPPTDSVVKYWFLFGGDAGSYRIVTSVNKPISMPVGKFSKYVSYVQDLGLEKDSIVFVPGVGIVCRVFTALPYPGREGFVLNYSLQHYSVKNE